MGGITDATGGTVGTVTDTVGGITDTTVGTVTDTVGGTVGTQPAPDVATLATLTPPIASPAPGTTPSGVAATRAPPASPALAGATRALRSMLRSLSLPFATASSASAIDRLPAEPSAPGSRPAPNAPGPLGAPPATPSAGSGPSPSGGGYWLWLFASLFASAGLAVRLKVATAAWRSTATLALLERPG